MSLVVKASGNCNTGTRYQTILKLVASFLDDHFQNANTFSNTLQQEMNKTIHKK